MIPKTSILLLQKNFIDAYMKGHPDVAASLRHYNALAEWNKIKTDQTLIKSNIEKYLSIGKAPVEVVRKRTISSDDESPSHDPLFDPDAVVPVTPTFSKRGAARATDPDDPSKPWVIRGLEKAKARVEAHLAKIEARKVAKDTRVKAPVQEAVIKEIEEITQRIENLTQVKNMGLSTEETNFTLKRLMQQKKERTTELSLLKSKQRAGLRYRARRKKRIESLCAADPEVANELLKIYKPSTISILVDDVGLDILRTIEDIARIVGVSGIYNPVGPYQPCQTLDELRMKIKERGFEIRRTNLFYRLIPAGCFTDDGKKHVSSSLVRMRKLRGVEIQNHIDCHFVAASLKHIRDLAGTFGNDCVLYLVQDSKASIRIGRRLGQGHSPMIMHLDYQISSVDGNPIPPTQRFQLKPIVYASCVIDDTGLVCPTGPTYVSIRSAKHDRMSLEWDDVDFDRVVKLREFERTARNHIGEIKPIVIMNIDRIDPKDFTRFIKTLHFAIKKFQQYNLDAFILSTQAPGQSIFNTTERRIALLAQDLSGLVLPDHHFGTHLDFNGITIDAELEKENLKRTGETLAEIWTMDMIDNQPVLAEFIDPPISTNDILRSIDCQMTMNKILDDVCQEDEEDLPLHERLRLRTPSFYSQIFEESKTDYHIDEYWCATHVFQTQYSIQIVRCTKPECCGPWRSNYIQVFPHRFLPPPVPFHRSASGVRVAEIEDSFADINSISPYYGTLYQRIQFHGLVMRRAQSPLIPFDAFCPSIQNEISSRLCSICKQYIPLNQRLRNHYKVHQQRYAMFQGDMKPMLKKEEEEDLIDHLDPVDPSDFPLSPIDFSRDGVFLFDDMTEWLKADFEEEILVEAKQKSVAATAMAAIRREKQLQAAFAAANAASIRFNDPTRKDLKNSTTIESVATISVDAALVEKEQIKIESETSVVKGIEQLNVNDDNLRCDSYDDLSDLIEQI